MLNRFLFLQTYVLTTHVVLFTVSRYFLPSLLFLQLQRSFFFWPKYFSLFLWGSLASTKELFAQQPILLSKAQYQASFFFFQKLANRLMKHGMPFSRVTFEKFYIFIKFFYRVDPWLFVHSVFLTRYDLPFKVSVITLSNRNYYFPDPFLNDQEVSRFLVKKFGSSVKKRSEQFFLGRVFGELTDFLKGSTSSTFMNFLESVFLQGLDNRAYVHYRWYGRKRN